MRVIKRESESSILGRAVIQIEDWQIAGEFLYSEEKIIEKYNPVRIIYSVSTGFNIHELNRLIRDYAYQIVSTKILVRKIFNQSLCS